MLLTLEYLLLLYVLVGIVFNLMGAFGNLTARGIWVKYWSYYVHWAWLGLAVIMILEGRWFLAAFDIFLAVFTAWVNPQTRMMYGGSK